MDVNALIVGIQAGMESAPPPDTQEKEITVTENGTTEVMPDEGKLLSKVIVSTEVGGSSEADLISAIIDGSVTEIESNCESIAMQSLMYREKLTSAIFPNAKSVGSMAFYRCYGLKSVDFAQLQSIESMAFQDCRSMTAVILRSGVQCTLRDKAAFANCDHINGSTTGAYNPDGLKDGYFYVPSFLVESYKVATNWSSRASQFRALEDYTVDGTITGKLDPNKI